MTVKNIDKKINYNNKENNNNNTNNNNTKIIYIP